MELLLIILRFLSRWFPGIAKRMQLRPVPKRPGKKHAAGPVVITVPLLGLTFVLPQFRSDPAPAPRSPRKTANKGTSKVAPGVTAEPENASRRIDFSSLPPSESRAPKMGEHEIPQGTD